MISIVDKSFLKKFGDNLRDIRKVKNISQGKLSVIAEIPLSQIGRIERGEINTTISTALRIANALDIETKDLFDFKISKEKA